MFDRPTLISRNRILIAKRVFWAVSALVAGYCMLAGLSSGGWHTNHDGEPTYSPPVYYSAAFYTGLRWSVFTVGGVIALFSFYENHRVLIVLFTIVTVLFNPIAPVHMSKPAWQIIDLLLFWLFLVGPGYLWFKETS